MRPVRIACALAAGAALGLVPAAAASATEPPTHTGCPGFTVSAPVISGVLGVLPVLTKGDGDGDGDGNGNGNGGNGNGGKGNGGGKGDGGGHGHHQPPPPPPPPDPPPVPPPAPPPAPPPPAPAPPPVQQPPVAAPPAANPPAAVAPARAAVSPTNGRSTASAPRAAAAVAAPAVPAQVIVQPPASADVGQPLTSGSVKELPGPGIPQPFQLLDISLWQYGLVLVVLLIGGLAAWVLHLRGARW